MRVELLRDRGAWAKGEVVEIDDALGCTLECAGVARIVDRQAGNGPAAVVANTPQAMTWLRRQEGTADDGDDLDGGDV